MFADLPIVFECILVGLNCCTYKCSYLFGHVLIVFSLKLIMYCTLLVLRTKGTIMGTIIRHGKVITLRQ